MKPRDRVKKSAIDARPRQIRPTHPGAMLREDFLPDYQLTISGLARSLRVSRQRVHELLQERRAVSPEMALRLARLFGNTAQFWLNAQLALDLWETSRKSKKNIDQIMPLKVGIGEATLSDQEGVLRPQAPLATRSEVRDLERARQEYQRGEDIPLEQYLRRNKR
jgi:addiction module HigA family antidote